MAIGQELLETWGPWLAKADQLKSGAGARIYLNVPRETLAAQLRAQSEQQGEPNVPTDAPAGGYRRTEPNEPNPEYRRTAPNAPPVLEPATGLGSRDEIMGSRYAGTGT